jgi:hypothetical protein
MEGSVLSFLKAERKVSDTGSAHRASSLFTPSLSPHRGHSIDASYQVSDQLVLQFQRRRLKCEKLTEDGRQVMAKAYIAFGKVS